MVDRAKRAARNRADIIRHAFLRYHAGDITLADLMRTLAQWRR